MKPGLWKFMRMRPLNFPTIRISQFSALIQKHSGLFSKILECTTLTEAHQLLNVSVSDYWKTHYMPDKPSARREKRTGQAALDNIVINTIAPFLFLYGGQLKEQEYINRALRFLSDTPAEQNTIIRKFEALGIKAKNAHESQALLQLYSYYCSKKQCCSCAVGNVILRSVNDG